MKWLAKILFWIVFFVVPMLFIGPTISSYHTALGTEFNDIQISHAPNLMFIQNSMIEQRQLPFWNPHILGGYPFDADPLSGLWYPPGWLALLFPQPLGINLVILLHIGFGGIGLFLFLQKMGITRQLSLFTGICFTVLPKLYAHFGAGHATYLMAFCLTPWLLLASTLNTRNKYLWQGLILGGIILADARWLPYALLVGLTGEIHGWLNSSHPLGTDGKSMVLSGASAVAVGLGLSAGFLIPLAVFTSLSTRSLLTAADSLAFSLPPAQLLSILFPSPGGSPEWMVYGGIGLFFLALIAVMKVPWKRTITWVSVFLLSILLAIGQYLPGMAALADLPVVNLLRVPPRIVFAGLLALLILAAIGFESLVGTRSMKNGRGILIAAVTLLIGSGLLAGMMRQNPQPAYQTWLITPLVMFVYLVLVIFHLNRNMSTRAFVMGVSLIIFLELGMVAKTSFLAAPNDPEPGESWISTLSTDDHSRVYSPSYSVGQDQAVHHHLYLVEGVHPLQLRSYVNFLASASGVYAGGYSVVQPPLSNGNPREDNRNAIPDPVGLARLNTRYAIASYPLTLPAWKSIKNGSEVWIYENPDLLRYPILKQSNGQTAEVRITFLSPNRVQYSVKGPGVLLTSEVDYPGWIALLDGMRVPIRASDEVFRSVDVPAGEHQVVMVYKPWWTYLGLAVSIVTLAAVILGIRKLK